MFSKVENPIFPQETPKKVASKPVNSLGFPGIPRGGEGEPRKGGPWPEHCGI